MEGFAIRIGPPFTPGTSRRALWLFTLNSKAELSSVPRKPTPAVLLFPPVFQRDDAFTPSSRSAFRFVTRVVEPTRNGAPAGGAKVTAPEKVWLAPSWAAEEGRLPTGRRPLRLAAFRLLSPAPLPEKLPTRRFPLLVATTDPANVFEPVNRCPLSSKGTFADKRPSPSEPLVISPAPCACTAGAKDALSSPSR